MVQQISALIVQPTLDASKYTAGANEKATADKAMAASSREVGAAAIDTSAKISTGGDVLARLSRQYVEGYAVQQRFTQGLGQLNRGLETGKVSIEGAERILVGMNQRLGLTANAADLAAKGQMTLAAAVERANVQIARQANDLAAADAANRRMQAANSNGVSAGMQRAAGFNAGQQIQDIAMMSLVGQSPGILALQQGSQLATAIQQGGGLAAVGAGLASVFSMTTLLTVGFTAATAATIQWAMKGKDGAKSLDDALKAHSDTLKLMKDQYGALGEAAKTAGNVGGLAFTDASARNAQALIQAQLREKTGPFLDTVGGVGWIQGLLGNGGGVDALRNLSGDQMQFAPAMAALIESAKSGKTDLAGFNDEVERLFSGSVGQSDNPARLRATADAVLLLGSNAFEVTGKFAPFADAINRLKVESADGKPNLSAFNTEIERIGQQKGLRKLADEAILAGKEIVSLADKAAELERVLQRLDREETRPGLSDRRALGAYVNRRSAEFDVLDAQFDADQQMARARTNAERLAAVEAQVRARAREDGDKGGGLQARVDRALAQERTRQEVEARDATIQRNQALERSLQQQRIELDLIGKTGGEQAKLRFEFERMQELRDQAARTGGPIDDKEVAAIKAAADAMGQYADAITRAKLDDDLQFERDQLFRTPQDQQIASRLRGTGIGLNSSQAQMMHANMQFAEAKDAFKGFLTTFESTLVSSGGDIGKAMGTAILNNLLNSMNKQWEAIFDQIATAFASALTGQKAGSGGAVASVGSAIAGKLLGGSNDNYAPGAVTRAPLADIGAKAYRDAIASIESAGSGGYGALGPIHKTMGQALGRYQIMEANLPAWSKAALGRNVGRSEFLGSPSIQDAIFDDRFGGYVNKYGASGAASMWFTGRPSAPNATDVLGTTGSAYVDKFNKALGNAGENLNTFGGGLGKLGNALNQFPAAPSGGGGGLLSELFGGLTGGLSSAFAGSSAFSWLSANPGGFIGLYADGTENAPPGWAWVGERGPELMRMRGGEMIRSNQRSAQMAADHANQSNQPQAAPKIELHTHVYGASGDDHIRKLVGEGNRSALAEYQSAQERGGFGRTQQRFSAYKG